MAMLYSVYRGEHFIDVGTCQELCTRWGWAQSYLRQAATPSHHRLLGERAIKVYLVCDENDLHEGGQDE